MNRYPSTEMSLYDLIKRSIRLHYITLKHTIFYILVLTLLKNITFYCYTLSTSAYTDYAITFVAFLIGIFLYCAAFLGTQQAFIDEPKTLLEILGAAWKKLFRAYVCSFFYILGTVFLYYLVHFLLVVAQNHFSPSSPMHTSIFLVGWMFILIYVGMFFFVLPLSLIEDKKVSSIFYNSLMLSEKHKIGVFVLAAIIGAIIFLIAPQTLHEFFLSTYHLAMLFDFLVLCVMAPIYINLQLLLISDAKLRLMPFDL